MAVANTVTYNKHDYVTRLRQRLNRPTNWMEVARVKYSDVRTIVESVISTEPSVVTGTRGTSYTHEAFALIADTLTISNYRNIPMFIDEADRYQQSYFDQMAMGDFQAKKINEYIEAQFLAQHTSGVNFGAGDLANTSSGDETQITVSATNIDDLIRAIKRKIYGQNGIEAAMERGFYSIWRPSDWEFLEGFWQANGFSNADDALKNGVAPNKGVYYLGMWHYLSNDHTANHLFAGVRKSADIGILRSTYGRVKFLEDPSNGSGPMSGLGVVSRVDYGFSFPANGSLNQLTQDVNVA